MDIGALLGNVFWPVVKMILVILGVLVGVVLAVVLLFFLIFWLRYGRYLRKPGRLAKLHIKWLPYDLLRWLWIDFVRRGTEKSVFKEYGLTIFTGRQGAGKTISMVQYLDIMRQQYPLLKIYTNFDYVYATGRMTSWDTIFTVRNGTDGVIFAVDEIQNEFDSNAWKDFPAGLLQEITMQRKQRIKIVGTTQVYKRIAKQLREQTFSVSTCSCWFGRLVLVKDYDAAEYGLSADSPYTVKKGVKPLSRHWYVQSDALRSEYDTWEKVQRLSRVGLF